MKQISNKVSNSLCTAVLHFGIPDLFLTQQNVLPIFYFIVYFTSSSALYLNFISPTYLYSSLFIESHLAKLCYFSDLSKQL